MEQLETIEQKLQKDLKYIKNELIAEQTDGHYCKFSRALGGIAIIGLTETQYMNYWKNQYKNNSKELPIIMNACKDKFLNGLISQSDMIDMINNSNDHTKDRNTALELLGGKV